MNFDLFDQRMRQFGTREDIFVARDSWIVARLDGRNFTKLTKEHLDFETPFDTRMHYAMLETATHLMTCGFRVLYGYTQSDEISLLLHRAEQTFSRKERKLLSVLAGEASAKLSLCLQTLACFDCRLSVVPQNENVVDYFRWRAEDAHRNALNAWCYWTLRDDGFNALSASKQLEQVSIAPKIALLKERGIDFHTLPAWQRHGSGLHWIAKEMTGTDPRTQQQVTTTRRKIAVKDISLGDKYGAFLRAICASVEENAILKRA